MPFVVKCRLCSKKFKTGESLTKHFHLKHHRSTFERARFKDDSDNHVDEAKAATLEHNERKEYLKWLSVMVERINSSLVPDHPGNTSL